MKNEKHLDQMLNLLDNIEKRKPSDSIISAISEEVISTLENPIKVKVNTKFIVGIAASLVFLVCINIYTIGSFQNSNITQLDNYSPTYDLLAIQNLYHE